MLGVPLFCGLSRARFLRAGGAIIGASFVVVAAGCATTAGSASFETSKANYDRAASQTSRPARDDTAIGLKGATLERRAYVQASRFGAEYRTGHVVSADLARRPFTLHLGKETLQTKTLIIASGASARWLGLPNEQALIGHGVSSCATCDGFFFSGKPIAVVGGGDTAMEEASFLSFASSMLVTFSPRLSSETCMPSRFTAWVATTAS